MTTTESVLDLELRPEDRLCFTIHAAARAFDGVYRVILRETGLTYPQYLVLLVLWERDELPIKALGEALRLDSGTLSPLVKRLEAAGLVKRRRSTVDERSVTVHLTDAGTALRGMTGGVSQRILEATGMTLAQIAALKAELTVLTQALDASTRGPAD